MYNQQRLLDILTRYQIYIEGLKAGESKLFQNEVSKAIEIELMVLFSRLKFKSMSSFTKRMLLNFISDLKIRQNKIYNTYIASFLKRLEDFMIIDLKMTKIVLSSFDIEEDKILNEDEADEKISKLEDKTNLFPLFWIIAARNGGNPSKLWSYVNNEPLPANGILLKNFLANFKASASNSIENEIRKAWVNKEDVSALLNTITGKKELNFKDGVLSKVNVQNNAVVSTIIQHVNQNVQAAVASFFFGKYQWISIIDNVTTEICIDRNLKIYEYGKGPLPPAHIRCRSNLIPLVGSKGLDKESYQSWLNRQPEAFKKDISDKNETNLKQFGKTKPLTLSEFESKVNMILKR